MTNMEENEGWAMFRRTIIIIAILLLILAPIFLYVYLERGLEGAIDFFADRIIGVMFADDWRVPSYCSINCPINCPINKTERIIFPRRLRIYQRPADEHEIWEGYDYSWIQHRCSSFYSIP